MTLLYSALELGKLWPVFPVAGKIPRVAGGFKAATQDPDQIRSWWAEMPDSNIGVATGAAGLVVLDVDNLALLRRIPEIPETLTARTSRGKHFYFRGDTRSGQIIRGVDVKSRGGYVVAPPSVHASGTRYAWTRRVPPAPAPEWLGKHLNDAHGRPADVQTVTPRERPSGWRDDGLDGLSATIYIPALLGVELDRARKVCCPFHPDREPSLHAYTAPEDGWYCFGCQRGGDIITFGALLYGLTPRGRTFWEIRERLTDDLCLAREQGMAA